MIDIKEYPIFVRSAFSMDNACLDYDQETSMRRRSVDKIGKWFKYKKEMEEM
jgi:hypothetical protein